MPRFVDKECSIELPYRGSSRLTDPAIWRISDLWTPFGQVTAGIPIRVEKTLDMSTGNDFYTIQCVRMEADPGKYISLLPLDSVKRYLVFDALD